MSRVARFEALRAKVAALEAGGAPARAGLSLGDPRLDGAFPAGGLPLGCWHEVAGEGLEIETGAVAGAFAAVLARPLASRGVVVWVMRRDDLYAPGLAGLGFPADRLIQVLARDEAQVLAALEDALGAAGVVAAIGEAARLDLTAGRRLQLACEKRGSTGFLVRRRPFGASARAPPTGVGSAAATRWTVASAPSAPPPGMIGQDTRGQDTRGQDTRGQDTRGQDTRGRDTGGLGAPRWRADLTRCRGGRPGGWILEMSDGPYPLSVVAELGDRQLAAAQPRKVMEDWRRAG